MGIHHFFKGNVEQFQEMLIQLLPSLSHLANQTELIWMNQYPILPAHKYFYPKGLAHIIFISIILDYIIIVIMYYYTTGITL